MEGSSHTSPHISIIGITGGIGSGKSVVSRILRLNGYRVYDCDYEAKRIMEHDASVRESLSEIVGEDVYDVSGKLDKNVMASRIFGDAGLRDRVNKVVHRAVMDDLIHKVSTSSQETYFCESAILSTSGFDRLCNKIWLIEASEDTRVRRVAARNGLSEAEIRQRMDSQSLEFDGLPRKKLIRIYNDGDELILPEVLNLINNNTLKRDIICSEKF